MTMKIQDAEYSVTLNQSKAARDFYDLALLKLTLKDFSNTKKIQTYQNPLLSAIRLLRQK